MNTFARTATRPIAEQEALQARFAYRLTARLDEQAQAAPHEIGERLRVAREQALSLARLARAGARSAAASPSAVTGVLATQGGPAATLSLGGGPRPSAWWMKLAGVLPLLALVGGLVLIQEANWRAQIHAAAEIDSELLVDDLPPDAYSDPGFAEFLKTPSN